MKKGIRDTSVILSAGLFAVNLLCTLLVLNLLSTHFGYVSVPILHLLSIFLLLGSTLLNFGFDRTSISILDNERGIFTDHAFAGYSESDKQEVLSNPSAFSREEILTDFKNEFKISNIAYFIPFEKQASGVDGFVAIRDKASAIQPRASEDSWHELDLLYFALQNGIGELIGYLHVDYPRDGKKPSMETVKEIELFASIAAVGVENLNMFKRAQSLIEDNELRSSRMLELFELIRSVLRVENLDVCLQRVSHALASTFGFRKTGVSVFTEGSNSVSIHSLTGYTCSTCRRRR